MRIPGMRASKPARGQVEHFAESKADFITPCVRKDKVLEDIIGS